MKTSSASYRKPFLCAVVFHMLLLVFFLLRWQFNDEAKVTSPANEIVQATLACLPSVAHTASVDLPDPKPVETKPDRPPAPLKPPPVQLPQPKPEPKPKPVPKVEPVVKVETPAPAITKPASKQTLPVKKAEAVVAEPVIQKIVSKEKQTEENQKKLQDEMLHQMENEKMQEKMKAKKQQQKEMERLLEQDLAHANAIKPSAAKSAAKSDVATKTISKTDGLDNKEIDRYKGLIISAISHRWIVPENLKKGLECRLAVRMAPGGVVTQVKLVKSSGDAALDRSAESAVYKASPLPVPKGSTLFAAFREFNLVVRPEGMVGFP